MLKWQRLNADGTDKPDSALIFSNQAGDPIGSFRTSWVTAVLKAHGIKPSWKGRGFTQLSEQSQQRFRMIDLHWHDLRHEYASRLVERGVPLSQVRDLLGHASITTTERYDNQTLETLHAAAARLESGKAFVPPDARTEFPDSFKVRGKAEFADDRPAVQQGSEMQQELDLGDWLGGRDDFRNWLIRAA